MQPTEDADHGCEQIKNNHRIITNEYNDELITAVFGIFRGTIDEEHTLIGGMTIREFCNDMLDCNSVMPWCVRSSCEEISSPPPVTYSQVAKAILAALSGRSAACDH